MYTVNWPKKRINNKHYNNELYWALRNSSPENWYQPKFSSRAAKWQKCNWQLPNRQIFNSWQPSNATIFILKTDKLSNSCQLNLAICQFLITTDRDHSSGVSQNFFQFVGCQSVQIMDVCQLPIKFLAFFVVSCRVNIGHLC